MTYKYPATTRLLQRYYRFRYRNKTSAPFLSQSYFKSISDFVITHNNFHGIEKTLAFKQARVIYCQSNLLIQFLEAQFKHQSAVLIFSGGSDTIVESEIEPLLPSRVHSIYIQNSLVSNNRRIFTLPIGLEDLSLGLNGVITNVKLKSNNRCGNVMVGPFSPTHPDRETLLQMSQYSENLCVYPRQLAPKKNAEASSRHQIITCPRGGGLDTHRVWETLYRGSVPILLNDAWARSLSYLDVPIHLIQSWSYEELKRVKNATLELRLASSLPTLWAPHWETMKLRILNS